MATTTKWMQELSDPQLLPEMYDPSTGLLREFVVSIADRIVTIQAVPDSEGGTTKGLIARGDLDSALAVHDLFHRTRFGPGPFSWRIVYEYFRTLTRDGGVLLEFKMHDEMIDGGDAEFGEEPEAGS